MGINLENITIDQFNEITKQYRDFRNYDKYVEIINELAEVEEEIDYDAYAKKMDDYYSLSEVFTDTVTKIEMKFSEEMSYFKSEENSEMFWKDFYEKIGQIINVYSNIDYKDNVIDNIKDVLTINRVVGYSEWGNDGDIQVWIKYIKILWEQADALLNTSLKYDSEYEIPFILYQSLSKLYKLNKKLKDLI